MSVDDAAVASQRLGFAHVFEPAARAGAPTLLLLHGTGGDEHDLLPLGRGLAPGAALLSPRGRVLERGMPRFFRRLAEGVFDVPDLIRRSAELADFVSRAAGDYGFDAGRVIAVGFSNGANIAASLLLLHPGTLAGAVLFRPMVPLEPEVVPDLDGLPVLIAAGLGDPVARPPEVERLAALLRRAGARVTVRWADAGHELSSADLAAARATLAAEFGA